MYRLFILVVVLAVVSTEIADSEPPSQPRIWALLLAGSNGWYNYRHQADVCHAYQILHRHGIPDERIVVMMYDDIANNKQNPTPGKIINHPAGADVYKGVPKDYNEEMVTPQNFLGIMQGKKPENGGSGKVIDSNENDHVFINMVDHGATGIFAFPNGLLTVKDLITTLNDMHAAKRFGKMVIYVEACEAGSMFKNHLDENIEVYATTASSYNESSYACYFDKQRQTYLGDWYSVHWMENSDKIANFDSESLYQQFQITKKETNTSHAEEFGDMSINKESVANFQGFSQAELTTDAPVKYDAIASHRVTIDLLYKRLSYATDEDTKRQILGELKDTFAKRRFVDATFNQLARSVSSDDKQAKRILTMRRQIMDLDCHDTVVKFFSDTCMNFGIHSYALKWAYTLTNMCEEHIDLEHIIDIIGSTCQTPVPIEDQIL